ncbi:MAG: hypothetical protein KID00_03310 [Clostridium argentinense]|uniref:DUF2232 domain-containing protein n=1 Tax=Clostridium faecium TaxID=2762223 RepID=A0ABR8YP56_9CLOT|nr:MULTISPECIES: hypothetical protein [Clostridium]MBD8046033.1 hypothetical protein [Clostridium faecium]MBS5822882.1 hypothetical protein [Clostridium argentinense]MDU1349105.1 hypothetical protein [Clostridium argentinense]
MGENNTNNKARFTARGGIYVALSLFLLYSTSFLPFNTIFILGLTSAIIPLSILTTNIQNSVVVYISVSILSYFLIPSKSMWLSYTIFFGIYGFVKLYIERLRRLSLEFVIKIVYFNMSMGIFYLIYKFLFVPSLLLPKNFLFLILAYQFMFIIYDYALTIFITYIDSNFIHKLNN